MSLLYDDLLCVSVIHRDSFQTLTFSLDTFDFVFGFISMFLYFTLAISYSEFEIRNDILYTFWLKSKKYLQVLDSQVAPSPCRQTHPSCTSTKSVYARQAASKFDIIFFKTSTMVHINNCFIFLWDVLIIRCNIIREHGYEKKQRSLFYITQHVQHITGLCGHRFTFLGLQASYNNFKPRLHYKTKALFILYCIGVQREELQCLNCCLYINYCIAVHELRQS